jgi:cytochrome b561
MPHTYTSNAKWFHWLIVDLVGLELLTAALMPDIQKGTTPNMLINLHMSFGVVIIIAMILRFMWRLTHRVPPLASDTSKLQATAANAMHVALYILLLLIPIAGWMWASSLGWHVTLFGLIGLPTIASASESTARLAGIAHALLAGAISVLILLHTLAALYHWYIKKDDVIERILPTHIYTTRLLGYFNGLRG